LVQSPRRGCGPGDWLALSQDPSVKCLTGDPQARPELDGRELTLSNGAPDRSLRELADVGDVFDRH
jgi:hypothetical protein